MCIFKQVEKTNKQLELPERFYKIAAKVLIMLYYGVLVL
jgi:hypothetical protein